jgi:hypothetical protein
MADIGVRQGEIFQEFSGNSDLGHHGSASIKAVLPALTGRTSANLAIQEGDAQSWLRQRACSIRPFCPARTYQRIKPVR